MKIATVHKTEDGRLSGTVQTLMLQFELELRPVEAPSEKAPGFRAYGDGVEVGAAWLRTAKDSGNAYLSVEIDDPAFAAPLWARLTRDKAGEAYSLWWERESGSGGKGQPAKASTF